MGRPGDRPRHAVGDVLGRERRHPPIDRRRPLRVAAEPDEAEFGLHEAWRHLGDPDRRPQELEPQGSGEGSLGVLGRRVARPALIHLEARDAPHDHHVTRIGALERREEGPGDPHRPQDVHLEHPPPVVVGRLGDRLAALGPAGVVHQDLAVPHGGGKGLDRRRVGDVQPGGPPPDLLGQRLQAVHPPRSDHDLEAEGRERAGGRPPDPGGGPRHGGHPSVHAHRGPSLAAAGTLLACPPSEPPRSSPAR